jgi:uncharacterized protein YcbK (DUF882 family)
MGDLTRNFNLSEFRCKDGAPVPDKYYTNVQKLAENLQKIRDIIDEPLVIVSGYRTPEHNRTCGGAKHSQHLTASAADIRCAGVTNQQLYDTILDLIRDGYIHDGGVGIYDDGTVHYDIRPRPARWDWRGGNNPNKKKDTK